MSIFSFEIPATNQESKAINASTDWLDTLIVNKNSAEIALRLFAGTGSQKPEEISGAGAQFISLPNNQNAIQIHVPAVLMSECSGFGAFLILTNSTDSDTLKFSRPVKRTATNCDDIAIPELTWTPISVTAKPDSTRALFALSSVFSNGSYDKKEGRLLKWNSYPTQTSPQVEYAEYSTSADSQFNLVPGQVLWLKSAHARSAHFGPAITPSLTDTFAQKIAASDWTDFSLPFNFPISLKSIALASGKQIQQTIFDSLNVYKWNKIGQSYITEPLFLPNMPGKNSLDTTMLAGSSNPYAFFYEGHSPVTLYIPPTCTTQGGLQKRLSADNQKSGWNVKVLCSVSDNKPLSTLYLGGGDEALQKREYPPPPSLGPLSVTFFDLQSKHACGNLFTEKRLKDGLFACIKIVNNGSTTQQINLSTPDRYNFPQGYSTALFTQKESGLMTLIKSAYQCIAPQEEQFVFLAAGSTSYLTSFSSILRQPPGLSHVYPNPFVNHITVHYNVPFIPVHKVTLMLLNTKGQMVYRFVQDAPAPGMYKHTIMLHNLHGTQVSAGTYFLSYRIEETTKKVLIFTKQLVCL